MSCMCSSSESMHRGVMSDERTPPVLTPRVLIDTHCHVHVLVESGTGCCSSTTAIPKQPVLHISSSIPGSGSSSGRYHRGGSSNNEGKGVRAEVTDSGEGRKGSVASVLPEVVHMTMGIREGDWHGAVALAAGAENLKCSGDIASAAAPTTAAGEKDETSTKAENGESTPAHSYFKFGLGLHPWYAHARSEDWLRDLTALLEQHPHALVGEIGLDKVARTPDTRRAEWDDQLEVFQTQMELAARMSRPVSVHCVKAHGKLVDFLRGFGRDGPATHKSSSGSSSSGSKSSSGGSSSGRNGGGGGGGGGADKGRAQNGGESCGGDPSRGGGGDGLMERKAGRPPAGGQKAKDDGMGGDRKRWRLPPRIALHSFTGSVEVTKDIARLGVRTGYGSEVFFGFSAAVNMRGDRETKRLADVLRVVPDSRVLIETDRRAPAREAAEELLRVCGAIAEAKGISIGEAAALANGNAARFLAKP